MIVSVSRRYKRHDPSTAAHLVPLPQTNTWPLSCCANMHLFRKLDYARKNCNSVQVCTASRMEKEKNSSAVRVVGISARERKYARNVRCWWFAGCADIHCVAALVVEGLSIVRLLIVSLFLDGRQQQQQQHVEELLHRVHVKEWFARAH